MTSQHLHLSCKHLKLPGFPAIRVLVVLFVVVLLKSLGLKYSLEFLRSCISIPVFMEFDVRGGGHF